MEGEGPAGMGRVQKNEEKPTKRYIRQVDGLEVRYSFITFHFVFVCAGMKAFKLGGRWEGAAEM